MQLLQSTAPLPGPSGQRNSCNALPQCLGAAGSATPAKHCRTVWGQWAVQLLQCTASLPGSSGQCNSCNTLPHRLGAVDSATPAMHCPTAWGQWAVQLLQCTASLPGGSGQCNSCNTLPHCLGAVGSGTPAMQCLTAWGQWAVHLLQWVVGVSCRACGDVLPGAPAWGVGESTPGGGRGILQGLWGAIIFGEPGAPALGGDGESSPGGGRSLLQGPWGGIIPQNPGAPAWGGRGVLPRGWSGHPSRPMGGHLLRGTVRTGLGGTGSPSQGVFGASRKAHAEPSSSNNRAHRPGGDGGSCPGGVRSILQGPWGGVIFGEPGAPAWGGRGVQPRGCLEPPARPTRSHPLLITGRTGLGGTGSPAQGVVGASFKANGGPSASENRAHRPGGDGESDPICSEPPAKPMGGHYLRRTGRTGLGGTGSPAQGVVGASFKADGGPSASENRAHRPGGGGESSPGGVRSLLPSQRGAICFGEPGAPAWRDGESSPGGVLSLVPGQGGAISFREPGAPAWGGRGALPRGCSEPLARPTGGHLLQRTGRTGLGGTGSPAQGVFGASCQATGGPISSESRAHRPGGDGDSCPGGVRSLLQGQWGAIFFREPGAPARGGRGVLPRGCSESPARPMGGHLLQRTGRTGPGGTGSPAQGVFGVSWKASGGPSSSENRAQRPGGNGESSPGGVRSLLPGPMGGHLLQRTGRTGLGGTGSPAQGVFGASCKASGGPSSSENRAHRPGGNGESSPGGVRSLLPSQWGAIIFREPGAPARGGRGVQPMGCSEPPARANGGPSSSENRVHRPGGGGESCPGGVRSLLQGQWGAIFFREPGAPARGGRGVLPRGCSESPARPVGGHLLQGTGRTGPGGTGSPAQGVFGVSCKASGGPSSSENRAHRPGGNGESSPGGVRSLLPGPMGGHLLQRTGRTGLGGTGSPAQGVFGASCKASGGPSSSENRAHRPGGNGESCPGGVRSLLPSRWGAIIFREPGAPARGGRGVLPRGCSEPPARANGGPSSSENRAHRPGRDGESCPGGVRSLLQGQWGAIFFREPGAPAWGERGVLPRGCSEPPARPVGGHLLQRTGRTGLGGTGSPAQGVFGASCKASGGPSSSGNRAHRPGGDGESCPGGVRSLLPGQWGAIFFREPGAPARGGRGVLPRGCSESPARPVGGHLLQITGRTGLGGTGSPAQGVFGASCQGQWGGHLLQRTGRTGPGGTGSPAQGVFGASCKASGGPSSSENRAHRPGGNGESCPGGVRSLLPGQWGAIFFREPGAPARGGRGVLPRGCSESPARPVGGHLLQITGRTGPGGNGESCPGGVQSLLPGPMGGHLLQRTGRTGPGGTGSPAQGVFGASCKASGGPSSSENRAHRPGGNGESIPGGVRSLPQGPRGAILF